MNIFFFPEEKAYTDFNINPLLIFVIIMAARYGIICGLYSAALTSGAFFLWAFPNQRIHVWEPSSYPLQQSFIIWILGIVIGSISSRHLNKVKSLKKTLDENKEQIDRLDKDKDLLLKVNHKLEDRILNEVHSLDQLYQISKGLEGLDLEYTYEKIPEIVCDTMNAEKASIYILHDKEMVLKENHGWTENMANRNKFTMDNSLMGLAWKHKNVQCIRDFLTGDKMLDSIGESVLSAPLISNDGSVLGIINIETIPFMEINRTSIIRLRLLAEWFSLVLKKAYLVEKMQEKMIIDEKMGVYKKTYLLKRLKEEFTRSRKYDLPLSLLFLKIDLPSNAEKVIKMERVITYLEQSLSEIDIVTHYNDEFPLAVLLTSTDIEAANYRADLILNDLCILLGQDKTTISIKVKAFAPYMEQWEEMLYSEEALL
ncbi:MAG: GAF domain-containing protein [Lentisphaeraceae bacterium]|nr:GAF domain-containing protein [Lentisphaeraceae bacterium]